MSKAGLLFERQGLHLLLLVALVAVVTILADQVGSWMGQYLGLSTYTWFWLALAAAVAHQGWVWLCWRLELHAGLLSRVLGPAGFTLYGAGFALLAFTRFYMLVALAAANRHTVPVSETALDTLATILLAPIAYLFYSVERYFTIRRALGIDHFDPAYRTKPLERRGIFRFTRNGMYTFGLLAVWLPGLYEASKAALFAALFNHAYIWVHYLCTELPDMRRIYGPAASRSSSGTRPGTTG